MGDVRGKREERDDRVAGGGDIFVEEERTPREGGRKRRRVEKGGRRREVDVEVTSRASSRSEFEAREIYVNIIVLDVNLL